jgi:hypothetical protein
VLIDTAELAGVTLDEVEVALEHEAAPAGRDDPNLIAGLKAGLLKSLHGNRRLMLCADPSEAATPFLYFSHRK